MKHTTGSNKYDVTIQIQIILIIFLPALYKNTGSEIVAPRFLYPIQHFIC